MKRSQYLSAIPGKMVEPLETRNLKSFTLNYDQTSGTYTATDKDDVGSDGGSRFALYVAGGKYMLQQKDNNGNNVGNPANLGANGAAGLTIYLGDGRDFYTTDSTVGATTPNGTTVVVNVLGQGGNDVMTGGVEKDSLRGGDGDDSMTGGAGNDTIRGDANNDTVDGGSGNDFLLGGTENDVIFTGSGSDSWYDNATGASDFVTDVIHYNPNFTAYRYDSTDTLINDQPT